MAAATYVFAGIPVSDLEVAKEWYGRLMGRGPDLIPNDVEAAWQLTDTGWIYVILDPERAGSAVNTVLVDDLGGFLNGLREWGIEVGSIETLGKAARRSGVVDPDGNRLNVGQPINPEERARITAGEAASTPGERVPHSKASLEEVALMATFVTIGYGDRAGYDRTDPAIRDAAHQHDEGLRAHGAVMGIAGQPVQVRNPEGAGVEVSEGSFLSSEMPIAGFALIEAQTIDEAVEMVSKTPCAVAHGVVEVWPLQSSP